MMLTVLLICVATSVVSGEIQDFSLRLNNVLGTSLLEGRLEIYYSGRWGTVCDDGFSNENAIIACASMGFNYSGAVIGNRYGAGTDPMWLDDVNCTGTESGIEDCAHRPWGENDCEHSEDVSISCDCGIRYFSGDFGYISSTNFPLQYVNYLSCNNFISIPSGSSIVITFLAFSTEACCDGVIITCESGKAFRSPNYRGLEFPAVLTISSCSLVKVYFHTDNSVTSTGFKLTYNITKDSVIGGLITKPSNAFPQSDKNYAVIFNCTTTSKYLPWWTISPKASNNYTITNSTCGVIASAPYSAWFLTESLGPGSCNLIISLPTFASNLHLPAGSLVCTDSTLSSARAILVPIDPELRITETVNDGATSTDIRRDEEVKISCNPHFTYGYPLQTVSSLVFTYDLYREGPFVELHILRTYWTFQGNVISSTGTANASSYVLEKSPKDGAIPRYTCNIVSDFSFDAYDISGGSSNEISFSTESVEVLYGPTEDQMRIVGDNNGQILPPALVSCHAAANPPATYTWVDESNGRTINGSTILIIHGGKYTCKASNIIRGQYYLQSKSVDVQGIENDMDRLKLMAIILGALLGAAVLTIVILLAVLISLKYGKQKAKADVGHINRGVQHELHEKGESNHYEAGTGKVVEVDEKEYKIPDSSPRDLPNMPAVYEELDNQI